MELLKGIGCPIVESGFYNKVGEWKSWYIGDVKGFSRYRVRTGHDTVNCKRNTLGMAKKISEDWANLLMNERVVITLEGRKEQEFVDGVLSGSFFEVKCNEMQELKSALGTVAYIPRVVGQKRNGATKIILDYVTVEHIWPISWTNGVIQECAFDSLVSVGEEEYIYLQIHKKDAQGLYVIQNRVFRKNNEQVTEVSLATVPGFQNVPSEVETKSDKRQFVIDRLNIANNFDYEIPLGVSVYANAIDILRGVDIAYDSYVNEFSLGKKRIMVKPSATTFLDGEPAFDKNDVVFYVLPEDVGDGSVVSPIDMTLRTQEHNTGIQDMLNLLSSKCGFGENHYRFDTGNVSTATQIISENSTLFRTLKKHEIILESALVELCRIILRLGNSAMNMGLKEDVEISIDFDDSIIEDEETDFNRDSRMLQMGILNDWEFRMKWMNEDEKTAKEALPQMESLVSDA
ncbi:MAG: phage portal protein [Bacteroidaceae bacterium]|nr:phage portal protein [Bacteroidaceae bacterium]